MQLVPVDIISKFHGEDIRPQDLNNLLTRTVRREVCKRCVEMIESGNDTNLIAEIDTFPVTFIVNCKEANIFPEKDLTFDIAAALATLRAAIERIGLNEKDDAIFKLIAKATYIDDDMWVRMGISFIEHDTTEGVAVLIEKNQQIQQLISECRSMWNQLSKDEKVAVREKMDTLADSYEFFSNP